MSGTTKFPVALDDGSTLYQPGGGDLVAGIDHAALHDNASVAAIATQTKLGISASTPTANKVLRATGTGTSAWAQVGLTTDVTGTLPVANGGTGVTGSTGTGNVVLSNSPVLSTPTGIVKGDVGLGNVDNTSDATKNAAAVSLTNKDLTSATNTFPTGFAVQQVSALFSAVATGSTTIPFDDTIPQITEGNEYMTLAITPKSATNVLVIQVVAALSTSASAPFMIMPLFQDATANALATSFHLITTATGDAMISMLYTMTAGTTSSTTFRIRAGANLAGTTTFNGQSGGRIFGATPKSSILITEYKA